MKVGTLRHQIAIQSASESRDAHGGVAKSWSTDATVWASIEPLRGRELFEAQQTKSEATHRVVIRHYDGLTTAQRLLFGSRVFEIEAILTKDERTIMQEILVKERT